MGWIIVLVFVAIGILFIYITIKVDKLDTVARDKGSEIDTALWDRAHQLSKLVEKLDANGIKHDIVPLDVNTFGLGMSAVLQATNADSLDKKDEQLRELLKEHPELEQDEEFKTHLEKFNLARNELVRTSLSYNKSANEFNHYIAKFPVSIVSTLHKKKDKSVFVYYFKEL